MPRIPIDRYWIAYARQNRRYERYGAKLFRAALMESARPALEARNPSLVDPLPIQKAYKQFYETVGRAHIEWERKQWGRKSAIPDLQTKEEEDDERTAPNQQGWRWGRRIREGISTVTTSFSLSFRNDQWLQRLKQLYNGLDVASRITNITETTRKKLQRLLTEYSQEEVLTRKVAAKLQRDMEGISAKRAKTIARTEATYVANEAAKQAAEETGLELAKVWVATLDTRTRDTHRALHRKKIDASEKFIVGGVRMDKPGDPAGGAGNCINCRCIVAYVPKED